MELVLAWNLFLMLFICEGLHVSRLNCSTARWLGGVRVSGGVGGMGGCDNVLSTTFLTVFIILHLSHALVAPQSAMRALLEQDVDTTCNITY